MAVPVDSTSREISVFFSDLLGLASCPYGVEKVIRWNDKIIVHHEGTRGPVMSIMIGLSANAEQLVSSDSIDGGLKVRSFDLKPSDSLLPFIEETVYKVTSDGRTVSSYEKLEEGMSKALGDPEEYKKYGFKGAWIAHTRLAYQLAEKVLELPSIKYRDDRLTPGDMVDEAYQAPISGTRVRQIHIRLEAGEMVYRSACLPDTMGIHDLAKWFFADPDNATAAPCRKLMPADYQLQILTVAMGSDGVVSKKETYKLGANEHEVDISEEASGEFEAVGDKSRLIAEGVRDEDLAGLFAQAVAARERSSLATPPKREFEAFRVESPSSRGSDRSKCSTKSKACAVISVFTAAAFVAISWYAEQHK